MIVRRIGEWARQQPSKPALVWSDSQISYAEFARAIESTRRLLAREGMAPGATAIVVAHNIPEAWRLVMAGRALGLTTAPAISMAAAASLDLKADWIIAPEAELARRTQPPAGVKVVAAPAPNRAELHAGEPPPPVDGPWGDHILYSSGTTGAHKKILVSGALEDERNRAWRGFLELTSEAVYHALNFGLWTGIGFKGPANVWHAGGTVVVDQGPGMHRDFLRHGPTRAIVTPQVLKALVDAQQPPFRPSERLLLRVTGGFAPLSLAERAVERLASRFAVHFGATEAATALMVSEFESPDDLYWLRPEPDRVIEIVDEDGVECPPGVEGELRFLITDVDSRAYLDDEAASAKVFRGGYFHPGDRAVRREDGRIRIVGRAADVINIAGRKYAVAPIELSLQRALDVDEVCLFAGMGEDGVDELVVAVQTTRTVSEEEIRGRLGDSSHFARVRVAVFPQFPRTQLGTAKTQRVELRRMVFGMRSAAD